VQILNKALVAEPGETLVRVNNNNVLMVDTAVEQGGMVILTPAPPSAVRNPPQNNPLPPD
jgi:hypothetical protein